MKRMGVLRPFIVGAGFGIGVWFLAGATWNPHGQYRFVSMLPVIFAQPVRLVVASAPPAFEAVLMPTVLGLEYALLGWTLSVVVRSVRRTRQPRFFAALFACMLVASYTVTWRQGTHAVRDAIKRERAADYTRLRACDPGNVARVPELRIRYAVPVLPFIVACEYDFIYGPLMGWGEGNLWLCVPPRPKSFCDYAFWVH